MQRHLIGLLFVLLVAATTEAQTNTTTCAQTNHPSQSEQFSNVLSSTSTGNLGMIKLPVQIPKPPFISWPVDPKWVSRTPLLPPWPSTPLYVPEGTKNIALHKPVSSSDNGKDASELAQITDGIKEEVVSLGRGVQWIQIDLQQSATIYAITIWHYYDQPCVFKSVIVQVSDDPTFIKAAQTLFNNDRDNTVGLGAGQDADYWEHYQPKLVDAKGVKARYVRLYSNGFFFIKGYRSDATDTSQNHYIEVEVYGK